MLICLSLCYTEKWKYNHTEFSNGGLCFRQGHMCRCVVLCRHAMTRIDISQLTAPRALLSILTIHLLLLLLLSHARARSGVTGKINVLWSAWQLRRHAVGRHTHTQNLQVWSVVHFPCTKSGFPLPGDEHKRGRRLTVSLPSFCPARPFDLQGHFPLLPLGSMSLPSHHHVNMLSWTIKTMGHTNLQDEEGLGLYRSETRLAFLGFTNSPSHIRVLFLVYHFTTYSIIENNRWQGKSRYVEITALAHSTGMGRSLWLPVKWAE